MALQQGHSEVVIVLMENDSRNRMRLPALHVAAKKEDILAATLLVQNGQSVCQTIKVFSPHTFSLYMMTLYRLFELCKLIYDDFSLAVLP